MILAVGGNAVDSPDDVGAEIRRLKPGDEVDLLVEHDGDQDTVSVTLGTRPTDTSSCLTEPFSGGRIWAGGSTLPPAHYAEEHDAWPRNPKSSSSSRPRATCTSSTWARLRRTGRSTACSVTRRTIDEFRQRALARLQLLPPHDPQFRRNRERVVRDAEREHLILDWDLGYEEESEP